MVEVHDCSSLMMLQGECHWSFFFFFFSHNIILQVYDKAVLIYRMHRQRVYQHICLSLSLISSLSISLSVSLSLFRVWRSAGAATAITRTAYSSIPTVEWRARATTTSSVVATTLSASTRRLPSKEKLSTHLEHNLKRRSPVEWFNGWDLERELGKKGGALSRYYYQCQEGNDPNWVSWAHLPGYRSFP